MTSDEIAKRYKVARITAIKWAEKNNVKREMVKGGIMAYVFTEADCKRFEKRSGRGRPRLKNKKT